MMVERIPPSLEVLVESVVDGGGADVAESEPVVVVLAEVVELDEEEEPDDGEDDEPVDVVPGMMEVGSRRDVVSLEVVRGPPSAVFNPPPKLDRPLLIPPKRGSKGSEP